MVPDLQLGPMMVFFFFNLHQSRFIKDGCGQGNNVNIALSVVIQENANNCLQS